MSDFFASLVPFLLGATGGLAVSSYIGLRQLAERVTRLEEIVYEDEEGDR